MACDASFLTLCNVVSHRVLSSRVYHWKAVFLGTKLLVNSVGKIFGVLKRLNPFGT